MYKNVYFFSKSILDTDMMHSFRYSVIYFSSVSKHSSDSYLYILKLYICTLQTESVNAKMETHIMYKTNIEAH